jgi:uncharacterized protein YktA (UPF0223 family)
MYLFVFTTYTLISWLNKPYKSHIEEKKVPTAYGAFKQDVLKKAINDYKIISYGAHPTYSALKEMNLDSNFVRGHILQTCDKNAAVYLKLNQENIVSGYRGTRFVKLLGPVDQDYLNRELAEWRMYNNRVSSLMQQKYQLETVSRHLKSFNDWVGFKEDIDGNIYNITTGLIPCMKENYDIIQSDAVEQGKLRDAVKERVKAYMESITLC